MSSNPPPAEAGTKKCPYCAETIKEEAIVCRYCGRDLVPDVQKRVAAQPPAPAEPGPAYGLTASQQRSPAPDFSPRAIPSKKRKPNYWPIFTVLGMLLLGMLICPRLGGSPNPVGSRSSSAVAVVATNTETPTSEATEVAAGAEATLAPTATDAPTATPEPTATVRPTSTPEPEIVYLVPGTQPADIKVNLQERQFECTSAEEGENYIYWACKLDEAGAMLRVDYYSRWLSGVDLVEATVIHDAASGLQSAFLGYMATMVLDCEMDERMTARAWVEETIPTLQGQGDVRQARYCGTDYELYGSPAAPILEIGGLP